MFENLFGNVLENMFKRAAKRKIPKSIDDCTEVDPVSEELWGWAESAERLGKILLGVYIAYGILSAIMGAFIVDNYGSPEGFDFMLFIPEIVKCIICGILISILYHLIALLIASLATITQSTRITAKLTEYNVRKAEDCFPTEEEMKNQTNETAENIAKKNFNEIISIVTDNDKEKNQKEKISDDFDEKIEDVTAQEFLLKVQGWWSHDSGVLYGFVNDEYIRFNSDEIERGTFRFCGDVITMIANKNEGSRSGTTYKVNIEDETLYLTVPLGDETLKFSAIHDDSLIERYEKTIEKYEEKNRKVAEELYYEIQGYWLNDSENIFVFINDEYIIRSGEESISGTFSLYGNTITMIVNEYEIKSGKKTYKDIKIENDELYLTALDGKTTIWKRISKEEAHKKYLN